MTFLIWFRYHLEWASRELLQPSWHFLKAAMAYITNIILAGTASVFVFVGTASADAPFFWLEYEHPPEYPKFETLQDACQAFAGRYGLSTTYIYMYFDLDPNYFRSGELAQGRCFLWYSDGRSSGYYDVNFQYGTCPGGGALNEMTGVCEASNMEVSRKSLGAPDDKLTCNAPSLFEGNPINSAIGNKFQVENDYVANFNSTRGFPLHFVRYYNSLNGLWSHSYAVRLALTNDSIYFINFDGRQSLFNRSGNVAVAESTELGSLTLSGSNWVYVSPDNDILTFNAIGQLTSWQSSEGETQSLTYTGTSVLVSDSLGHTLAFTEDSLHQPLTLQVESISVAYTYDTLGRMTKVMSAHADTNTVRQYFYEDSLNLTLLTGITDERGIRFATWRYDTQGRAISSEHANGTEKVTLSYNDDGSTTVTNEFGKQTIYRYQIIQGVKRIVAIEGEPSPGCSASNSSYTYNDRGQVLTKTDAQGIITTYNYNDRGLETSRTEASGTPLARTTTTEWDPVRFLRTKVVEPTRTTLYSYDGQGRALSQQVISH